MEDHFNLNISELAYNQYRLVLISDQNKNWLWDRFAQSEESDYFCKELNKISNPRIDKNGYRTRYAFYTLADEQLAGLNLLGISSWEKKTGYTGVDVLPHMRGRGIAPATKPLLFYLGFQLLNLERIETGCLISNLSSKRSIEKTRGFQYVEVLKDYHLHEDGHREDEHRYVITRSDWEKEYSSFKISHL